MSRVPTRSFAISASVLRARLLAQGRGDICTFKTLNGEAADETHACTGREQRPAASQFDTQPAPVRNTARLDPTFVAQVLARQSSTPPPQALGLVPPRRSLAARSPT